MSVEGVMSKVTYEFFKKGCWFSPCFYVQLKQPCRRYLVNLVRISGHSSSVVCIPHAR